MRGIETHFDVRHQSGRAAAEVGLEHLQHVGAGVDDIYIVRGIGLKGYKVAALQIRIDDGTEASQEYLRLYRSKDGDIRAADLHARRNGYQQCAGGGILSVGREDCQPCVVEWCRNRTNRTCADGNLVFTDIRQIEVDAENLQHGAATGIRYQREAGDDRLGRRSDRCRHTTRDRRLQAGIWIDGERILVGIPVFVAVGKLNQRRGEDRDVKIMDTVRRDGIGLTFALIAGGDHDARRPGGHGTIGDGRRRVWHTDRISSRAVNAKITRRDGSGSWNTGSRDMTSADSGRRCCDAIRIHSQRTQQFPHHARLEIAKQDLAVSEEIDLVAGMSAGGCGEG